MQPCGMCRVSVIALLAALAALAACSAEPPKTPEFPEAASSAAPKAAAEPAAAEPAAASAEPAANAGAVPKPDVDKSLSLETYELTPSDCNALGKQYGIVARNDQMAALSPKLSEKQRAATAEQVEKVV